MARDMADGMNSGDMDGDGRRLRPRTGGGGGGAAGARRFRRKVCRFCAEKTLPIDYKEARLLCSFLTERGKIIPSRITGTCAGHQRRLRNAIKQARSAALVPFTLSRK